MLCDDQQLSDWSVFVCVSARASPHAPTHIEAFVMCAETWANSVGKNGADGLVQSTIALNL